jgi:hypothetical protein
MEKVSLMTNGVDVRFRLPITKIDEQKRIVSGFATLDNVDREGDLVTTSASEKAFGRWRGNIREMHSPVAVGKAVNFETREYKDDQGEVYKGIYVDAYISTGAESTWQKVLDGTLSGFSIGGGVLKYETKKDANSGGDVRVITDYELTELSLVDSPANQLANIVSIHKSAGGDTVITGLANDTDLVNVFSNGDDLWVTSDDEPLDKSFEYIGWVEDNDDKISQIRKLLGGFDMSKEETVEKAAEVNEVESVEEAAEQSSDFESVFAKFSGEVRELVETSISKSEELGEQVAKATATVEGFGTKVEEVEKKFGELSASLDEISKRLETVEETGGSQKSAQVEKSDSEPEEVENPYMSKVFKGKLIPLGTVVQ